HMRNTSRQSPPFTLLPRCPSLAAALYSSLLSLTLPRPPPSPLFPYTTLFRSRGSPPRRGRGGPCPCSGRGCPGARPRAARPGARSEEHTSELQSLRHLVCRLLREKKKTAVAQRPPHGSGLALIRASGYYRGRLLS